MENTSNNSASFQLPNAADTHIKLNFSVANQLKFFQALKEAIDFVDMHGDDDDAEEPPRPPGKPRFVQWNTDKVFQAIWQHISVEQLKLCAPAEEHAAADALEERPRKRKRTEESSSQQLPQVPYLDDAMQIDDLQELRQQVMEITQLERVSIPTLRIPGFSLLENVVDNLATTRPRTAVNWRTLPHSVTLLCLEYRAMDLMVMQEGEPTDRINTSVLIGRFSNDPFRRWHLIYRTILVSDFFNIDEQSFDPRRNIALRLILNQARHINIQASSFDLPEAFKPIVGFASMQTMPQLKQIQFDDSSGNDIVTAGKWLDCNYINTKVNEVRVEEMNSRQSRSLKILLEKFPNLTCVDTFSRVDRASIDSIRQRHKIRSFSCSITQEEDKALVPLLQQCTQLKNIDFHVSTLVDPAWFTPLAECSNLVRLYFDSLTPEIQPSVFWNQSLFSILPSALRHLEVYYTCIDSLQGIERLVNLESVGLTLLDFEKSQLERLVHLPRLVSVTLHDGSAHGKGYPPLLRRTLLQLLQKGVLMSIMLFLRYVVVEQQEGVEQPTQPALHNISDDDIADIARCPGSALTQFELNIRHTFDMSSFDDTPCPMPTSDAVAHLLSNPRIRILTLDVPGIELPESLRQKILALGLLEKLSLRIRFRNEQE